jgi:hypothetical protein
MKYTINFSTLPQGDPTIEIDNNKGYFVARFLEKWNTVYDVETLIEYLNIIHSDNKEHEDYQDLLENGIYDDIQSTLFFKNELIYILCGEQQSEEIKLSYFKEITLKWKAYLETLNKNNRC